MNTDKAIRWARRHCDWQDIDDMAMLVVDIERADDLAKELALYRNSIAYVMGHRLEIPADAERIAKARDAIRDWTFLQGIR